MNYVTIYFQMGCVNRGGYPAFGSIAGSDYYLVCITTVAPRNDSNMGYELSLGTRACLWMHQYLYATAVINRILWREA